MRNELCNWVKPLILKRTGSLTDHLDRFPKTRSKWLGGGGGYENGVLNILLWNIKKKIPGEQPDPSKTGVDCLAHTHQTLHRILPWPRGNETGWKSHTSEAGGKILTGFTLTQLSLSVQSRFQSLSQVPRWGPVLHHSIIKIFPYGLWTEIHDHWIEFPNLNMNTIFFLFFFFYGHLTVILCRS